MEGYSFGLSALCCSNMLHDYIIYEHVIAASAEYLHVGPMALVTWGMW